MVMKKKFKIVFIINLMSILMKIIAFQKYFWENEGKQGGGSVAKWDNEELFNKK